LFIIGRLINMAEPCGEAIEKRKRKIKGF